MDSDRRFAAAFLPGEIDAAEFRAEALHERLREAVLAEARRSMRRELLLIGEMIEAADLLPEVTQQLRKALATLEAEPEQPDPASD